MTQRKGKMIFPFWGGVSFGRAERYIHLSLLRGWGPAFTTGKCKMCLILVVIVQRHEQSDPGNEHLNIKTPR